MPGIEFELGVDNYVSVANVATAVWLRRSSSAAAATTAATAATATAVTAATAATAATADVRFLRPPSHQDLDLVKSNVNPAF